MLQRLRHRAQGQEGFTLIELLVVVLIIGILAAVAIPVFLNQTGKANDANVKTDINSAATSLETYYTDNQTYATATSTSLINIDPSLTNAFTTGSGAENMALSNLSTTAYTITALDPNGISFVYAKANGLVTRTCTVPTGVNQGGCKNPGAASNGW